MDKARWLNLIMDAKGMTTTYLAHELQVKHSYISQLRSGKRGIGRSTLTKLEHVLEVSYDRFKSIEPSAAEFSELLADMQRPITKALPLLSINGVAEYFNHDSAQERSMKWLVIGNDDPLAFAVITPSDLPDVLPNDILIVSPSTLPSKTDYALIHKDGRYIIGRIQRVTKTRVILSNGEVCRFSKGDRVMGKIITSIRSF